MKKTCRTLFSLALAVMLLVSLAASAFAADVLYADGNQLTITGKDSTYTSTDLFGAGFKELMPGDRVSTQVTIKNTSADTDFVRLSLRVIPNDENTAEASTLAAAKEHGKDAADMLDFLAQLDIAVTNAATGATVFQGKADQQYGPAGAYLQLGDYKSGETVTLNVALSVPVTLDNTYANRVGEIDWQFLVEAFDHSQLTVVKQWSQDSGADHSEDSVTVNLLRDGEVAQTVTLNQANNWTYTFEKRMADGLIEKDYADHTWTVEETPVPEGYRVEYVTTDDGSTVVIHNIGPGDRPPIEYVDLTVVKVWGTIRDGVTKPNYVTVGVYDEDGTRQLTAILSPENNWTHTFEHIPSTWYVKEYNVPYGFTPSYYRSGNVVTVTNSTSLIQTGQLNWPIPVLAGFGVILLVLGAVYSRKKKRSE